MRQVMSIGLVLMLVAVGLILQRCAAGLWRLALRLGPVRSPMPMANWKPPP